MPRKPPELEEMKRSVFKVEAIMAAGIPLEEACKRTRLSRSTYYRYKNKLAQDRTSGIIVDWSAMAQDWSPNGVDEWPEKQLLALRRDVAAALLAAWGSEAMTRSRIPRQQLSDFINAFANACDAFAELDEPALFHLKELHEPRGQQSPFARLFERTMALRVELSEYIDALDDDAEEMGETAGGPAVDPRIGRCVMGLAHIYVAYWREEPHHTLVDGLPTSPFNRFVEDVRRHFLRDFDLSDNAFTDAMQHVCARIDWSDDIKNQGC